MLKLCFRTAFISRPISAKQFALADGCASLFAGLLPSEIKRPKSPLVPLAPRARLEPVSLLSVGVSVPLPLSGRQLPLPDSLASHVSSHHAESRVGKDVCVVCMDVDIFVLHCRV